jgi:dephospho-CoA kinase
MIVIGLTGSIGTGKSTVTAQFSQCGAATLNSDETVHALLAAGGEAVKPVAKLFPETLEHAGINRRILGAEVFDSPAKLRKLEAILHPLVRKAQDKFIREAAAAGKQVVVLDIPLLFETGGEKRCDAVVVTTAPLAVQRQRVLKRSGMSEERFKKILSLQMPDVQKRSRADFIVNTGLGLGASLRQVKRILASLSCQRKLASSASHPRRKKE